MFNPRERSMPTGLVLLLEALVIAISGTLRPAEASVPAAFVEVASKADVIVVGLVERQVNSGGANYVQVTPGGDAVLGLRIERVLKGDGVGDTLSCVWRPWNGPPGAFVGAYGLWFLAAEKGGLRLLSVSPDAIFPRDIGLPLPSGPLPEADRYAAGAALVDKLVVELRVATMSGDAGTVSLAYYALSNLLYRRSGLTYHHIQAPGSEDKTTCPTARMVAEFDSMVVAHHERLMTGKDGPSIPTGLAVALCGVSDPATIPGLARLLEESASGSFSKRCVAEALRNIHSGEALPLLVALLDDPDLDIQYMAVSGLARYANGYSPGVSGTNHGPGPLATDATRRHYPTTELFLSDPNTYVNFWKAWWRGQNNHAPTVSLSSASGTCHPTASGPCVIAVTATASDPDGDPPTYSWGGCCAGSEASSSCPVAALEPVACTVTVSDGRGGIAVASLSLRGVNGGPFCWSEDQPASGGWVGYGWDDPDADPIGHCSATCTGCTITNCRVTQRVDFANGHPGDRITITACDHLSGCATCSTTLQ